jgi:hypothetical protein
MTKAKPISHIHLQREIIASRTPIPTSASSARSRELPETRRR